MLKENFKKCFLTGLSPDQMLELTGWSHKRAGLELNNAFMEELPSAWAPGIHKSGA
jgi:hypothetical protein